MVFPFDRALEGINARFQTIQGGGSPFGDNPFGAATPFTAGGIGGGGGPQFQGFGNMQGPGFGGFGSGQSPFGANPFGNANPFGSNPFGGGGNPFGTPSWGQIANPFMGTDNDPFGTGAGAQGNKSSDPGYGSFDFTGPATATDNTGLDASRIDSFISSKFANSPLRGQGAFILDVANRYGISVPLLLGIAWKESGMGTNAGAGNIFGITDPSRDGGLGGPRAFQPYSGVQSEIEAAARLLATQIYKGKSAAEQIGAWYVGPQEYERLGLAATDRAGNGTVGDYLNNFIAPVYQALGVGYDPNKQGTWAGGGANRDNWEQVARSFTREGGGWVDYTNGGIRVTGNPKDGMDCSSFTGYVLGLDRNIWTAQAQANAAQSRGTRFYDQSQAKKGDLIFFHSTYDTGRGERVTHVGIYLGNGQMIHTGTPGRGVEIVSINTQYWQDHFDGFGRL